MLAALSLVAGCDDVSTAELKTPVFRTDLRDADYNGTAAFKKDFPLQSDSYQRNNETAFMSKYNGSINFAKNDDVNPLPAGYPQAAQPYLKNLWLGYPFMYEYNEARGHTYAIHDILCHRPHQQIWREGRHARHLLELQDAQDGGMDQGVRGFLLGQRLQ